MVIILLLAALALLVVTLERSHRRAADSPSGAFHRPAVPGGDRDIARVRAEADRTGGGRPIRRPPLKRPPLTAPAPRPAARRECPGRPARQRSASRSASVASSVRPSRRSRLGSSGVQRVVAAEPVSERVDLVEGTFGPAYSASATARLSRITGDPSYRTKDVIQREDLQPVGLGPGGRAGVAGSDGSVQAEATRGGARLRPVRGNARPRRWRGGPHRDRSWSGRRTRSRQRRRARGPVAR